MPVLRGVRPLTSSFANKMEENSSASEHVLRISGCYNHLNRVGVHNRMNIIIMNIVKKVFANYVIACALVLLVKICS